VRTYGKAASSGAPPVAAGGAQLTTTFPFPGVARRFVTGSGTVITESAMVDDSLPGFGSVVVEVARKLPVQVSGPWRSAGSAWAVMTTVAPAPGPSAPSTGAPGENWLAAVQSVGSWATQ